MIFGLLYFCVVISCVNKSRTSFILYRIVKRHSRQSNVRRIWTCADNAHLCSHIWLPHPYFRGIISDKFYSYFCLQQCLGIKERLQKDILMVFKCKNIRSMPGITNYIRKPFLVTMVTTRMHIVTTFWLYFSVS